LEIDVAASQPEKNSRGVKTDRQTGEFEEGAGTQDELEE
jgi:hypothetical protein